MSGLAPRPSPAVRAAARPPRRWPRSGLGAAGRRSIRCCGRCSPLSRCCCLIPGRWPTMARDVLVGACRRQHRRGARRARISPATPQLGLRRRAGHGLARRLGRRGPAGAPAAAAGHRTRTLVTSRCPSSSALTLLVLWEGGVRGFGVPMMRCCCPRPPPSPRASPASLPTLGADFCQTFMRAVLSGYVDGLRRGLLVAHPGRPRRPSCSAACCRWATSSRRCRSSASRRSW